MSILSVSRALLVALAVLPLVIDHNVFFPYITAKSLVLRVIVALVSCGVAGVLLWGKKDQRDALVRRVVWLLKTPVFGAFFVFVVLFSLGALWASDGYRAFWGDIERAEGVVGMWFFFLLFILMALLFDEQRWRWLFRGSLVVGGVLFVHSLLEIVGAAGRSASFLGNPIYLAVIFLFVFVSGLVGVFWERRGSWWRIAALVALPASLMGILLTQSRGVVAGLGVALVAVAIYAIVRNERFVGFSGRIAGIVVLSALVFGGGIFFATRSSSFWQYFPGLDRLANFSFHDTTFQTRILSTRIGLDSVSPSNEGWGRLLFGWGPENYSVAYNTYYDPAFYALETPWFDRAHNKLVDVLVMNGLAGLAAYVALWGVLVWGAIRAQRPSIRHILLFFLAAYFIQNLFAFDALPMYVVWVMMMAFIVQQGWGDDQSAHSGFISQRWTGIAGAVIALGLMGIVVRQDVVGYMQIYEYRNAFITRNPTLIAERMPNIVTPFTPAQEKIRVQFTETFRSIIQKDVSFVPLVEQGIGFVRDLIDYHPYKVQHYLEVANAYRDMAIALDDSVYFANAAEWFDVASSFVPNRPDIYIVEAFAYQRQGYGDMAIALYDKGIALNPNVGDGYYYKGLYYVSLGEDEYPNALALFEEALDSQKFWNRDDTTIASLYWEILQYFYEQRDADAFITTANRLVSLVEEEDGATLSSFSDFARENLWGEIHLDLLTH